MRLPRLTLRCFVYPFFFCYFSGVVWFFYSGFHKSSSSYFPKFYQTLQPQLESPPIHSHLLKDKDNSGRSLNDTSLHKDSLTVSCGGQLYRDSYFQLITGHTYIFSAYLDERPNNHEASFLRLLILSDSRKPNLWCYFEEDPDNQLFALEDMPPHRSGYYEFSENHGSILGGYMASCRLPLKLQSSYSRLCHVYITHIPKLLDIQKNSIKFPIRHILKQEIEKGPKLQFGVCLPAIFGDVNWLSLVEFFELSLLLGAQHFTVYYVNANSKTKAVLHLYEYLGLLTVIPWRLDLINYILPTKPPKNKIWNFAQTLNVNDCLLRTALQQRYTSFNDIDEFIVPMNIDWSRIEEESPWQQMTNQRYVLTQAYRDECAMCFASAFFDISKYKATSTVDNLRTLTLLERGDTFSKIRSKCLSQNLRVFEHGVHHISKQIVEKFTNEKVNYSVGLLFHYRTCQRSFGIQCKKLVHDDTIPTFFGPKLKHRIQSRIQNLFSLFSSVFSLSDQTIFSSGH